MMRYFAKKILLLGTAAFLSKVYLVLLPYLLDASEYNQFNQFFYLSSTISVFSLLGFDYLYPRYNAKISYQIVSILALILVSSLISSFFVPFHLPVVIMVCGTVLSSYIATYLLFSSSIQIYFYFNLAIFLSGLLAVPLGSIMGDVFLIYSLGYLGVSIAFIFLVKFPHLQKENILLPDLFKLSIGVFLLNSVAALFFSYNKLLVNQQFDTDIANAFTYLWAILVPVLYIGNLFEKYIYARVKKGSVLTDIRTGVVLNSIAVAGYIAAVNIFINVGSLLPDSIDAESIGSIATIMSLGFLLLSVVHFPVNGVLLKIASVRTQKLSSLCAGGMVLVSIFVIWYLAEKDLLGLTMLITITFGTLVAINIVKGYLVWFEVNESVA